MPEEIKPTAVYSVAQVSMLVHCDRRVVRAAIDGGELQAFVPNGCTKGYRVMGAWVIQWLEKEATRGQG